MFCLCLAVGRRSYRTSGSKRRGFRLNIFFGVANVALFNADFVSLPSCKQSISDLYIDICNHGLVSG